MKLEKITGNGRQPIQIYIYLWKPTGLQYTYKYVLKHVAVVTGILNADQLAIFVSNSFFHFKFFLSLETQDMHMHMHGNKLRA